MNGKKIYCEECVEEIPNDELYWDEKRLYCGRCGSEIEREDELGNVYDTIASAKVDRLSRMEDEDFDDEFLDEEDEEDEDGDLEEEELEEA